MSRPDLGTVFLVIGDTEVVVSPANVRPLDVSYDRRLFRAPYGDTWHTEGEGLRSAELFTIEAYVFGSDGVPPSSRAAQLVSYLLTATLVRTPLGSFRNAGVESLTVTPVELGYRVDATLIAVDGLHTVDLFLYAPNVVDPGPADWKTYIEGLGYTVDLLADGTLDSSPLAQYRAGVVVGSLSSDDKEWLAGAPVPILGQPAVHDFAVEGTESLVGFSSASIVPAQEGHPVAAGLSGAVGVFSAGQFASYVDDEATLAPGSVAYLADSVRFWALRGLSPRGQRRLGFPMTEDPADYHAKGNLLFAAALAWVVEGSSSVVIDLNASDVTTVPNLIGRETTLIGDESILIGAETITV